ncbi:hypothetical protein [Dictyobacter kobayashii]|nr:hypothetical protein [Dictyobacter kobayashii]
MEEVQNICPRCQTHNMLEAKNCQQCRVNLYWAHQHYAELATLRQDHQLAPNAPTASFLLETSRRIDTGPTAPWLHRKR